MAQKESLQGSVKETVRVQVMFAAFAKIGEALAPLNKTEQVRILNAWSEFLRT